VVLRDVTITINAVDLTNQISSVEIPQEHDDVEETAFGDAYKVHSVGIPDGSMTFNFFQDFSAGSVDATLFPIFAAKVAVPIVVRPTAAAVSATNPKWTMQGLLLSYTPLAGSVGEASQTSVTFVNGSSTGIVRATS
jgi:hypothetical protein